MNADYCKQALEKVGNPNVLVNLISRRVRQLNTGGGGTSRPLIQNTVGLSSSDIAFLEIIEDKMAWELPDELPLADAPKRRKRTKK